MVRSLKLGKKPARHDMRVPRMSKHAAGLPPPPAFANWYADVPDWYMLANDRVGNCVEAAVMHVILQQTSYADEPIAPPMPTDAEALAFYSAATGYDPTEEGTDQGSYVLGPGGVMDFWFKTGVTCGGVLNKPTAFLSIAQPSPNEWQQAIATFGNLLVGVRLPETIVASEITPPIWFDASGPEAGGHEILIVGYRTTAMGVLYNLVSWGQMYQATEAFLLSVLDEAVTVVDAAFINTKGVNPAGVDLAGLQAAMDALRGE